MHAKYLWRPEEEEGWIPWNWRCTVMSCCFGAGELGTEPRPCGGAAGAFNHRTISQGHRMDFKYLLHRSARVGAKCPPGVPGQLGNIERSHQREGGGERGRRAFMPQDAWVRMLIIVISIIAKSWNEPKYLPPAGCCGTVT